jgi:hypothetical protein
VEEEASVPPMCTTPPPPQSPFPPLPSLCLHPFPESLLLYIFSQFPYSSNDGAGGARFTVYFPSCV